MIKFMSIWTYAGFGVKYDLPIPTNWGFIFYRKKGRFNLILFEEEIISSQKKYLKKYRWAIIPYSKLENLTVTQLTKLVEEEVIIKKPIKATISKIEKILEQEYYKASGEI